MANIKHFSDFGGETVQLAAVYGMLNAEFAAKFPGIIGKRYDSYRRLVGRQAGSTTDLPVTRTIEYKKFASKHVCDARCLHASGRVMKCECACGGVNHGKGN